MNPDEDIVLNIGASTVDVESALGKLQSDIQRAFASGNSKVRGYGIQLDKLAEKIERQRNLMREIGTQRVVSPEYARMEQSVERLVQRQQQVVSWMNQMRQSGLENTNQFRALDEESKRLVDNLLQARLQLNRMRSDGSQYQTVLNTNSPEYQDAQRVLNRYGQQYSILAQKAHEAANATDKVASATKRIGLGGLRTITKLGNLIRSGITNRMKDARYETKGFGDDARFSFKKALNFLIKYGLGMASLFRLYRRLRMWTKEAMTTMGKAIPEIGQQILQVSNAAIQLKNSLATVAQPLFTYLLPAIQTVISALVTAMNTLANFFAMLTGQGYIYKAAKGNKKLADSIGGAGKAAKEAKEEIAEYDKLIVLDQPNAGGGGGGAGGAADDVAGSFEKVDGQMTHFIQDIQRMWDVFKQAWEEKGQRVMAAWDRALTAVKQLITDIWHTIVDVFTDGTGLAWVESLLELFATVLDTVYLIASAIDTAWNKDNNGYKLVKSILEMWTSIQDTVQSIIDAWNRSWASGIGVTIIEHILHIFTNIHTTVKNLSDAFRRAWEENDRGKKLFDAINEIIEIVLANVEDITEDIAEWAADVDFAPLLDSLTDSLKRMKPFIDDIGKAFKWIWDFMVAPGVKNFIEIYLPAIVKALGHIAGFLHELFAPLGELIGMLTDDIDDTISFPDFLKAWMGFGDEGFWTTLGLGDIGETIIQGIWDGFIGWWNLNVDIVKWFDENFIQKFKKINISSIWENLWAPKEGAEGGQRLYRRDENPILQWFSGIGDGLIDGLTSPFENFDIKKWCEDNIVQPIKDFFGIHSPSKLMKNIGIDIVQGLWDGMLKILHKMQIKLPKQTEFIASVFGGVAGAVATHWDEIKEGAGEMVDKTKEKIQSIPGYFKEKFNTAYQGATKAFSTIGTYFQNKKTEIQSGFSNLPTLLTTTAKTAYTGITGAFSGLGNYMKTTATTAYNNLTGAFSGTSKAFQGVANSITTSMSGAWNSFNNQWNANTAGNKMNDVANKMKAPFKGFANWLGNEMGDAWSKIVNAFNTKNNPMDKVQSSVYKTLVALINSLISRINKAMERIAEDMRKLADRMGSTTGKSRAAQIVAQKIPAFPAAKGAVIPPNKEFLAVLGDQKRGTNIETPLDTMIDAFRTALREDGGGASNNAPIVLQLNGRTVAEAVWDETEKRYKQKGISGAFAY